MSNENNVEITDIPETTREESDANLGGFTTKCEISKIQPFDLSTDIGKKWKIRLFR